MIRRRKSGLGKVLRMTIRRGKVLAAGILLAVVGAVLTALIPPIVLERVVNRLTAGSGVSLSLTLLYFGLLVLSGALDSLRESLLIVFGQKIAHGLRSALCAKVSLLPAETLTGQEPGAVVSRFVGDVDTVESLFTSGIVSMFADGCKVIGIFAILFIKNKGLALTLLLLLPFLLVFTRKVQKKMLTAQMENRAAVGRVTNHIPETIRCIRTIHGLHKEGYMAKVYDRHIQDSYDAVEKTNFYDSIYSPVILVLNAGIVAGIMLLSAMGNPSVQNFFGMSVGTAVAVISYIGAVFAPLESIGMEIQTIQSAVAGVERIEQFLSMEERWDTDGEVKLSDLADDGLSCVELKDVTFGYEADAPVLKDLSFSIRAGEHIILTGRTGNGKSTVFKLLLGLYRPQKGRVLLYGKDAALIPDAVKRRLFGYVEQNFTMVSGTVLEQITLFDHGITREAAEQAAKTVGLHEAITALEQGYDTPCTAALFSQGQRQLLAIARAIAAEPKILLLDEITANLDADTECTVLAALQNAAQHRTVLSISHRYIGQKAERQIEITGVKS